MGSVLNRRLVITMLCAFALQTVDLMAENRLCLRKGTDGKLWIMLTNADAIAGMQFTINARGGILLQEYEGTERVHNSETAVHQYLHDDQTLNVLLLAPCRSSLPGGEGVIGRVSFTCDSRSISDSACIFLTNFFCCNVEARELPLMASDTLWDIRSRNELQSSTCRLEQNYPNPFNPSTMIAYTIDNAADVSLTVYNMTGQLICTLVNQYQAAGAHQVRWDARDGLGRIVPSGMYFARLRVGAEVHTRKLMFTK